MSYAYFAANSRMTMTSTTAKPYNQAYMPAAPIAFISPKHLDRAIAMIFKACGLKPHTLPYKIATKAAWWQINRRAAQGRKIAQAA